jgi:hypothetical protein
MTFRCQMIAISSAQRDLSWGRAADAVSAAARAAYRRVAGGMTVRDDIVERLSGSGLF